MKQHSRHSGTCSCTSCVYQSQSSRPSVQHLIEEGSRVDRLYYGKYLPLRERKLLEKLIRTRAVYDDVRTQLLSSGSSETRSDYKIKRRDDEISNKSSAVIKIVDLVDRGQIGSTNSSRLSSCCSCCECASLKKIKKHMDKHPPPVHRHQVPYEAIAKYTVEAEKRGRKRRQRLTTKISSKIRSARFKAKQIRSAPISSRMKLSSTTFAHKKKSKERMAANAQAQKIIVDPRTIGKKICNCSCRFAKIPMKSFKKIKSMRKSSIKGTEIADQKNFNIRKDSLTLFREKQDKQQALQEYECPPGICEMDDHDECTPEECLEKIKKIKALTPLMAGEKSKKYHHRISGARRDQSRVSISTRPRKIKHTSSQVQTTKIKSKSSTSVKGSKSVSSMTSSSKTKTVRQKNKSERQKLKTIETQENKYTENEQTLSNTLQEEQKTNKADFKKTKANKISPKSKIIHVICECKPSNKSTTSMTGTEGSRTKSSKQNREKTFKIGRKSKKNIPREHRTTEHSIKSNEIEMREIGEEKMEEPVEQAVKISSSEVSKAKSSKQKREKTFKTVICECKPSNKSTTSMTGTEGSKTKSSKQNREKTFKPGRKSKKDIPRAHRTTEHSIKSNEIEMRELGEEEMEETVEQAVKISSSEVSKAKSSKQKREKTFKTVICECKPSNKSTTSMTGTEGSKTKSSKQNREKTFKIGRKSKKDIPREYRTTEHSIKGHEIKMRELGEEEMEETVKQAVKISSSEVSKAKSSKQKREKTFKTVICECKPSNKSTTSMTGTEGSKTKSSKQNREKTFKPGRKPKKDIPRAHRTTEHSFKSNEIEMRELGEEKMEEPLEQGVKISSSEVSKAKSSKQKREKTFKTVICECKPSNKSTTSMTGTEGSKTKSSKQNREKTFKTGRKSKKDITRAHRTSEHSIKSNEIEMRELGEEKMEKPVEQAVKISSSEVSKAKSSKQKREKMFKTVICECKPSNKSTTSMTGTEGSKTKSSKQNREKTFKTGHKSKKDIHREHRITEHNIQSHEIKMRESGKEEMGEPVKQAVNISSSFRFEIEFSKKRYPTLTDKEIVDHVKSKRQKRLKKKYRAKSSQESQASYLRETASQTTRTCESSICMAQECPATCTQVSMPYACTNENCTSTPKARGRTTMSSTDRIRRKSAGSATSTFQTSSRSKYIQSKSMESFMTKPEKKARKIPPRPTLEQNVYDESSHPNKQAVRIGSSFSFSIEFYKENSPVIETEEIEEIPHKRREKSKQTSYRPKYKNRGHQPRHTNFQHTSSQSRTSQSAKAIQAGHRLKRCFCALKLMQKKKEKISHAVSKKTMATFHNKDNEKVVRIRQTQTKSPGITYRIPPETSRLLPYECEPSFCTPGECNPYECAERIKQRNRKKDSHHREANTFDTAKKSAPALTSQSVSSSSQSYEYKKRKQKRKRLNTLKTETEILPDKPEKQAVRVGSSFTFNVEFSKENSGRQEGTYVKAPVIFSESNKPTQMERKRIQQKGIKVHKPRVRHVTSEMDRNVKENETNTAPFLQRCFCTLKLFNKNKKKTKLLLTNRNKNDFVVQMQNRSITRNRAYNQYQCDPYECEKYNDMHDMLSYPNDSTSTYSETSPTNISSRSRRTISYFKKPRVKAKKTEDTHRQINNLDLSPRQNNRQTVRVGSNYSFDVEFYKENISDSKQDQDTKLSQKRLIKVNNKEGINVGSSTKNCFCTLKLQKKGKSKIPISQICDCKSTNTSHRSPSPQNMCECKSTKTNHPLKNLICECKSTSAKKSKLVKENVPDGETSDTLPTNISSRYRDSQSNSKTQRIIAKQIEETYRQINNLDLPPSQTNRQAVRIRSSFSFEVEFYKENISDGKQVLILQDQDTKSKLKPTKSPQLTPRRSQKTPIEVKNKEKGTDAGSAIKRCFCTLKLQKKRTSKIPISQICECKSTNTSHRLPSPKNTCECKSTKTIYPLPSQICECKSTSTKKSKLVNENVPASRTSRICDPYECKRLYNRYTSTEKRRKKSVSSVTPTGFSGSSKRKITKSKFDKCPCDEYSAMMRDIRPKSSVSSSRQAVCLSSNFSFGIEFFKECFAPPVQDSKHKATKYYTVSDQISTVKDNRDRGIVSKQIAFEHHRLQASNIAKKENKGSNVGLLLRRCFCTLGLQKKRDLKNENPVTCFCGNQPITTQFVQVLHMGLNKSRDAECSNTNENPVFESHKRHNIIKSRHSSTIKTLFKNKTITLKSQEEYNPLDKKVFDVKQESREKGISLHGTRLLSREVITRSFLKSTRIKPHNDIDIVKNTRPATNIITKSRDNLLLHSLRSDLKKKSPFYQSFYALNLQVSNHHTSFLEPNECEPGFCVPYQCDPVECLKRINSRYKRSQLSGTVTPKSKCKTCFTNRLQSKSSGEHFERHKQRTSTKNAHVTQESPHPSRQSFNLGSNFSMALEFFKNTPHTSDGMTMTDKLRQAKDAATKCLRSSFQQAYSQINIKHRHKSIGTTPLLKRCFCTLKLMNNKYDNATILKHKNTMANKPFGNVIYNLHRKVMTDKLLPYECAPYVCVPGECDAIECYKLIQERLRKQREHSIGTDNRRHKSTSSFPYKKKHIDTGTARPKTKQIDRGKIIKASQKRNVTFGSNISFNVEFFRDTTNRSRSSNNEPIKQSSGRIYRNSQAPKVKYSNTRGSGDNGNRHLEPEIRDTRNSVAHMLEKCFCALKLARKTNPTEKPQKSNQKNDSFTKSSMHNKRQNKSKVKRAKETSRAKSAVMNKGTHAKGKRISKSFDCEPDICKPNTYDTQDRIKKWGAFDKNTQNSHQNAKKSSDFNNLMHKCFCKLTGTGKTLVPKPSFAQIVRVNTKGKLTHSDTSKPVLKVKKKGNRNKTAVDQNREMETIMPYSKEKFNLQESKTKLTQEITESKSSKRAKKQGKNKSKNSCLCQICDCDQAQDQDLCKCNTASIKAEEQKVGKKIKPKKQKKPVISNQKQSSLVSDETAQDDKDAKSKKRSKKQDKKKQNNSCLCDICNCDQAQDQDLCKCNTASMKAEDQKVGKKSKLKKQKQPVISNQEQSSLFSDEPAKKDKDAKSKKRSKKQDKKKQNNSCLCDICNCDQAQDQDLCKCNTASMKAEDQKVGKKSKPKKQKKSVISNQEQSSLFSDEPAKDDKDAKSKKRSKKQDKKKQNNSCLCDICNCDQAQDQDLCKCNTASMKAEDQKVGKKSKPKKQKKPVISNQEQSSLFSDEPAKNDKDAKSKKQDKKKQNNSCLCDICNCNQAQDQDLCKCNTDSMKAKDQKVGKKSKPKKQKKPVISNQEQSSLFSDEPAKDAKSKKRSKKQDKKKQNNSCLCDICNCDQAQDQDLCKCNTASTKAEDQKVGKKSKLKKQKQPVISNQEQSSLFSEEPAKDDKDAKSKKRSKKQDKKKQNNSCLCDICNCDQAQDQDLCKCNTASMKAEDQKVSKKSKPKKQKKSVISNQAQSSLVSDEPAQDNKDAKNKKHNKKKQNYLCLCEICNCDKLDQDLCKCNDTASIQAKHQKVRKQSKVKKQKKPKALNQQESSLVSSEETCDLCPDCRAAKTKVKNTKITKKRQPNNKNKKKVKSTKSSSLATNTDDCDLCPECRAANLNKELPSNTKLEIGPQSKNTESSCPCCSKTCKYQSRPRYISRVQPSPPPTPPPPHAPSISKIIKALIDKVSGFSNCMRKELPSPPPPPPQINNTPMFDVVVNKTEKSIMNRKDVLKNLDPKGRHKETEAMMKAREGMQNGTIAPPVMEVLIDKYNANIINSEEIFRKILPHEKRQKVKRKSRKRSRGICLRCASQRDADSYKSAPIEYSKSVRTGSSGNHDVGCNCCICRKNRSSISKRNKGAGDSKSIKSKSKAKAKGKAKAVQSEVVPVGVPGSSKSIKSKSKAKATPISVQSEVVPGGSKSIKSKSKAKATPKSAQSEVVSGGSKSIKSKSKAKGTPKSVQSEVVNSRMGKLGSILHYHSPEKLNLLTHKFKPCVCGSIVCKYNIEKMKEDAKELRKIKVKKCVCGSNICKSETAKQPALLAKAAKKQQRERDKKRKKIYKEKIYQQDRLARKKLYAIEDAHRWKQRQKHDKKEMKNLKKYEESAPDVVRVTGSLIDIAKLSCRALADVMTCTSRVIRHPKDGKYNVKDMINDPEKAAKSAATACKRTGISAIMARVKRRLLGMSATKRGIKFMESYAWTNFLIHINDKDPSKRFNKLKNKREREQLDFGCSLFMASLRKRPFLKIYNWCPWFYPHFVTLLGLIRQFIDILLLILAVGVWSPCIFIMELCRAMMCCCLCTA